MDSQAAGDQITQINAWYFEAAELKRAMLAGLAQLNRKIGKLNLDSITDPLTGLLNRRGMQIPLEQWQTGNHPFAVIAIDIDHFKQVNDQFGHDVGDQLLRQLAQLIRQVSRSADVLCRSGGEEFTILLPGTTLANACAIAERLRQCVADSPSPNGTPMTISLGVAHCPDSGSVESSLKQADRALYAAKHQGRNRVVTAGAL
ncbi:Response regulator PleD [compost metagenome]